MEIKVNFNSLQNALNQTGATLKYRFSLGKSNSIFSKVLNDFDKAGSLQILLTLRPIFMADFLFIRTFLYTHF